MSFLKNVLHDLVEKRLWPVAIALVAALVAVPIVLGGELASPVAPAADVAAVDAPQRPGQPPRRRPRRGRQPRGAGGRQGRALRRQESATRSSSSISPSRSSSPTPTRHGDHAGTPAARRLEHAQRWRRASTSPAQPHDADGADQKPESTSVDTYRVKLSFGEVGAMKSYDNVARLTPLPSSDNPFFVYLGLADDQKSAIFLINADAVPNGDGSCKPSRDDCQQIVLRAGDTEFFDLQPAPPASSSTSSTSSPSRSTRRRARRARPRPTHASPRPAARRCARSWPPTRPCCRAGTSPRASASWSRRTRTRRPTSPTCPRRSPVRPMAAAVQQTSTVLTVPAP